MRRSRHLLAVVLTVIVSLLLPSLILASEGIKVVSVEVEGAKRTAAADVKTAIATKPGSVYDIERIRDDVKSVFRMGYFNDVRFETEEVADGVCLVVVVVEKPIVSQVVFDGNKEIEASDLRSAVTIRDRSLFRPEQVKESAGKIVALYQGKGFADATIEPVVGEEPDGSVKISYRIVEGEKLSIGRLRFEGNEYLTDKAIRKIIETTEAGFFSFITDSGMFKKDVLDMDLQRIEALYQNSGFMDVKISDPIVTRGPKGADVTVRIDEGRQFRVGTVRFDGKSEIPESDMTAAAKTVPGALFSREKMLSDLLELTTLQNDKGYAQALVTPDVRKRGGPHPIADVVFRTEMGGKFRFGKVDIVGNAKTLDRIARRALDATDGRIYSATALRTSRENLMRQGNFKEAKIQTAPSKTVPDEIDVKIDVQEGPTGTLSGGAGFSSVDKFFAVVQLNEQNLFGRAWKAGLNAQVGKSKLLYSGTFTDPYFLDTDYSLNLEAYNGKTTYTDFYRSSTGGKVGGGYWFNRETSHSLAFRYDLTRIEGRGDVVSETLQDEIDKGVQETRSVIYSISRSTANRPIDPSRGTISSMSAEYAGGPLGGDSEYLKYFLAWKGYYPVTESTVFATNILWGHVVPTGGGRVAIADRFFLGGPYSIRGFESRSISPIDANTGEKIGGNKEFVANFEYIVPILEDVGIKGAAFFDIGNTWRQSQGPFNDLTFRYGAGIGIRWYSPMGPLRFEWGWNLSPEDGEPERVAEFTIGTAF